MTKITWGISANNSNAALSVFHDSTLVFASRAERFSRQKNDPYINSDMVDYAVETAGYPDTVVWYERPFQKALRNLRFRNWSAVSRNSVAEYLKNYDIDAKLKYASHHGSHAANGYFTSRFDNAVVLVIDLEGEWDTVSIWTARDRRLRRKWSNTYPHSIGLWYHAMCNRIGLTESEDLASASVLGNPYRFYKSLLQDFIMRMPDHRSPAVLFNRDFLKIAENWRQELQSQQDLLDIAAAVQMLFQDLLDRICRFVAENFSSKNLILCGDIATNPIANSIAYKYFDSVHIPVDPTDAGSALGAVLLKTKTHIDFHRPFVGYNIDRPYSNSDVIFNLATEGVVGVANGAAEFGSKSLGNRSLLADPRQQNIKQKIVDIKQQQFESFSPAILEEHFDEYFYGTTGPYQQYTAKCRNPDQFPAVVDRDGVSTVQTVSKKDNARFRNLLERWHQETGCPMLLNTSLNIQGEPIVNTWEDAKTFSNTCGVKVF